MSEGIKHEEVSALVQSTLKKLAIFHSYENTPFFDLVDAEGRPSGHRPAFRPGSDTTDPRNISRALSEDEKGKFHLIDRQTIKTGEFHLGKVKRALSSDTIVVARDYASADLINRVTAKPCLVAFNSANLAPVARSVHSARPDAKIFICADAPTPDNRKDYSALKEETAALNAACLQPVFTLNDQARFPSETFYDFALAHGLSSMNFLLGDLARDTYEFYLTEIPADQCVSDFLDAYDGFDTKLDSYDAACKPLDDSIPLYDASFSNPGDTPALSTVIPSDGCFAVIDRFGNDFPSSLSQDENLFLCSDFPSASSVNLALRKPVAITFRDANLSSAAAALHLKNPSARINFCLPCSKTPTLDPNFIAAVNGRVLTPSFTQKELKDGLNSFFDLHKSRGGVPLVNQLWVQARSRGPETQLSLERR